MIVADLPRGELDRLLAGPGLMLRTGALVTRLRSEFPAIAGGLAHLYAAHPIAESSAFFDFDVVLRRPYGVRRFVRPQVIFELDGHQPFRPLPESHAFPVLEWGLNWCVTAYDHHDLVLHAAAIEQQGRAVILPAPPGSGKSTLCGGLVLAGWRLLSDELTLVDPNGSIQPLARPVSLKNQSIDVIRQRGPHAVLSAVVEDTPKGAVAHLRPPAEAVRRMREPAAPGWIVAPRYDPDAPAALTRMSKARAFMLLVESAFNYHVQGRQGFETLARVVDACECYEFVYSSLDDATEVFARLSSGA